MIALSAKGLLEQEACALRTRLESVRAFSMHMPMVMAAAVTPTAMTAMERHVVRTTSRVRLLIASYLRWLRGPDGRVATPWQAQRRLTALRLWFAAMLSQFDIFAEAITQRSEHDYGVWLSGLDVLAEDAMRIPGAPYQVPPVVCYLDRGIGAAIRRIRTPLPGGTSNPVTIIRVPRERMIGSGIAASIVHECGHQTAALLDSTNAVRRDFRKQAREIGEHSEAIRAFESWIPEILSDFWSVGKLGIGATLGVLTVVSLPPSFVTRVEDKGTHPTPWVRVKLSAAMGNVLYPDPQWSRLSSLWEQLYPLGRASDPQVALLRRLEAAVPTIAKTIAECRPESLGGRSLAEIMPIADRTPVKLRDRISEWRASHSTFADSEPTLLFAVLGQAKFDGRLSSNEESQILNSILRHWALRRALNTGAACAVSIRNTDALKARFAERR